MAFHAFSGEIRQVGPVKPVEADATSKPANDSVDVDPRSLIPTTSDRIGRIWVPVYINDKGPFRMALDTGADASAILPRVVDALGIPQPENGNIYLHGVTGSSIVPSISADSVKVGGVELGKMRLPILNDAFEGADGILGTRGWENMRIFLDFENDHFHIGPSQGQKVPRGFYQVPISLKKNLLIEIDAQLGRVKTRAIFDSGSQRTIGNIKLRDTLVRNSSQHTDQDIIGVTLDITRGRNMVAPPIVIGRVQVDNVTVAFSDVYIFDRWNLNDEPALLLGMDVIASTKAVIIDYKKRQLFIKVSLR